ncbi:MAG: hypothetical protein WA162_06400 [Thermodesulfobacteriota bacterium]
MKKALALIVSAICVFYGAEAFATPSTHIWAPSTDVQAYLVPHVTYDVYIPVKSGDDVVGGNTGSRPAVITNIGLTVGVLPYEKLQLELGFDHITGFSFFSSGDLDDTPIYFNAKLGVPEGALGANMPALAIGSYMLGTNSGGEARAGEIPEPGTDFNVHYAKVAKTFGSFGRLSAGYYTGNKALLVDENGKEDASGILLCWERTMSEISDKLGVAVDYMGGDNSFGALSYGGSWKFSPKVSVIAAYVDQNNDDLFFIEDWFTLQADIDF